MKELLTHKEIREICSAHGYSVKPQSSGPDELDPRIYSIAEDLIEGALKAVLIVHQRNKRSALKLDPSSTLDIPQYETFCPQYARDFQTLEVLMDKLQASLVQRQVNSTKLWNMSVVDKHGSLIYGVSSQRLGPAMHHLIAGVAGSIPAFTNEPIFPPATIETEIEKLKSLCTAHGFNNLQPIVDDSDTQVVLQCVEINSDDLQKSIAAALTIPGSPLYISPRDTTVVNGAEAIPINIGERLVNSGGHTGQYYLIPIYDHYDTIQCGEWNEDWLHMKTIASALDIDLSAKEEGKYTIITVNGITFSSIFASSAMRYANCYLGSLALAAHQKGL